MESCLRDFVDIEQNDEQKKDSGFAAGPQDGSEVTDPGQDEVAVPMLAGGKPHGDAKMRTTNKV